MTEPFSYSTTYILDKAHFNEVFANSVVSKPSLKEYGKAIAFVLAGVALLFTDVTGYLVYFLMGLGLIEALSTYYRQPWWVARQMLSRAASNKVTITIDEGGIHTDSIHLKSTLKWQDVNKVDTTQDGLMLLHSQGKSYLSGSCLSEQAKAFVLSKAQ